MSTNLARVCMDVYPDTSFGDDFVWTPGSFLDFLNDLNGPTPDTSYAAHTLQRPPVLATVYQGDSHPSSEAFLTENFLGPPKSPVSSTSSLNRAVPVRGKKRGRTMKQAVGGTRGTRQKERLASLQAVANQKLAELDSLSAENASLKTRARILDRLAACREQQLYILTKHNSDAKRCAECGAATVVARCERCLSAAEADACKIMPPDELRRLWKNFMTEASTILLKTEGGSSTDTSLMDSLTNIVQKVGCVLVHVALLNQRALNNLMVINLESNNAAAPDEEHWKSVVAAAGLSIQQKCDVLIAYKLFLGRMKTILQERKLLNLALGNLITETVGDTTSNVGAHDVDSKSVTHVQQQELVERLHGNLGKERAIQLMLCCFTFGKTLSAVQFSKLAVYSYPYFPDPVAIANIVAASFPEGGAAGVARSTVDRESLS